jgi:hypothetical protein
MKTKFSLTLFSFTLGLGLALIWLLAIKPAPARAAALTVCPAKGSGCQYTSLQAAVDAAGAGDVIKVAAGAYTAINNKGGHAQVVYIDKSITIQGGYTTAFTEPPDPQAHPTTLDAQGKGRVFFITGSDISPTVVTIHATIEGLRITGGDASGLGGYGSYDGGGGVYAYLASVIARKCTIYNNIASTKGAGYGGGLELLFSGATLDTNTIENNQASHAGNGYGGGLFAYNGGGYGGPVTLTGNILQNNTASLSAGGVGGGLEIESGEANLTGNTLRGNYATSAAGSSGSGGGASFGAYDPGTTVTLTNNLVQDNFAGSFGFGGGLNFSNASATLTGNQIINNTAGMHQGGSGGGLIVYDGEVSLIRNTISGNIGCISQNSIQTICYGGGVDLNRVKADLTGNTIQGNTAMIGNSLNDNAWGGGIYLSDPFDTDLTGNTVQGNLAGTQGFAFGGGIAVSSLVTRTTLINLTENSILTNTAGQQDEGQGGGIYLNYRDVYFNYLDNVTTTLHSNLIAGNTASRGGPGFGGGLYAEGGNTLLDANTVEANIASTADWGRGGGLSIGGQATLTGNFVRGNIATTAITNSVSPSIWTQAGGLDLKASQASIEGNVFVNNTGGTAQAASCGAASISGEQVTFTGNAVQHNTATIVGIGKGGGLCVDGGASLTHNLIEGNLASTAGPGNGGGVLIGSPAGGGEGAEILADNTLQGNTASTSGQGSGGGVYVSRGNPPNEPITITRNLVRDNVASVSADGSGGGLFLATTGSTATVDANTVFSNVASLKAGAAGLGGGVYIMSSASFRLTNNVVAANQANTRGSGIWIPDGGLGLAQTTLADNHGSPGLWVERSSFSSLAVDYLSGLYVTVGGTLNDNVISSTVVFSHTNGVTAEQRQIVALQVDYTKHLTTLTLDSALKNKYPIGSMAKIAPLKLINTIVSGHSSMGVSGSGPFIMENTLWYANASDRAGVILTSQDQAGDPAFVSSAAGNYHLDQGSAAIDKGADGGVTTDLDGQPRPNPSTGIPDLGADEFYTGCTAIHQVSISGPESGVIKMDLLFGAVLTPPGATPNILYIWSPEPGIGQGTDLATYRFDTGGVYNVGLEVQNCGGSLTASHSITIGQPAGQKIYLPIAIR